MTTLDLRIGSRVAATAPSGHFAHGIVESHRTYTELLVKKVEYYVQFIGNLGADWYHETQLSDPDFLPVIRPLEGGTITPGMMVVAVDQKSLEDRAEFLVVAGKVIKDRHGQGRWPPVLTTGWQHRVCDECGHRHTGDSLAAICIGCPCERRIFQSDAEAE